MKKLFALLLLIAGLGAWAQTRSWSKFLTYNLLQRGVGRRDLLTYLNSSA